MHSCYRTAFAGGDGSIGNPYIICNAKQFNRIGQEGLLTKSFILGSDINFQQEPLIMAGSYAQPYKGTFDGKGYTLKSIKLENSTQPNAAPFPYLSNATVSNLIIDTITVNSKNLYTAGFSAVAENSTLTNIHVVNYSITTPDASGGLTGKLINSVVTQCSASGQLLTTYGADGIGGIAGTARNSQIIRSSANTTIIPVPNLYIDGVTGVGGLVGYAYTTKMEDVYAFVNIDYSNISEPPRFVGGLVGKMLSQSTLNRAYVVGPIVGNAEIKGAAVGAYYALKTAIPTNTVFWNKDVSLVQDSGLGQGVDTTTMSSADFWINEAGFSTANWILTDGQYPILR